MLFVDYIFPFPTAYLADDEKRHMEPVEVSAKRHSIVWRVQNMG